MLDFAEILRSESEQGSPVELRVPADVVVDLGWELLPMVVQPEFRSAVLAIDEYLGRVPIGPLAGEVVTALEQQDALPGRRESMGECASACAGANDDDVVMLIVGHEHPSRNLVLLAHTRQRVVAASADPDPPCTAKYRSRVIPAG